MLSSYANLEESKSKELYQLNLHTSLPNRNGGVRKSVSSGYTDSESLRTVSSYFDRRMFVKTVRGGLTEPIESIMDNLFCRSYTLI